MRFEHLPELHDYAVWANARVLAAAEALPEAARLAAMGHSFDSVQGTMVHVLSSEELWLARWQGRSPAERGATLETCPTIEALRARWAEVAAAMRAFLDGVAPAGWEGEVRYRTLEGDERAYPLWQLYLQVINHGTHHRAEAATMLTDLGHAPEALDMIFFFRERRSG